jgi:hypothetical protein
MIDWEALAQVGAGWALFHIAYWWWVRRRRDR